MRRSEDMTFSSIDPASGERWQEHPAWGAARLEEALAAASAAVPAWSARAIQERCGLLRRAGETLMRHRDEYALLMSREMGKVLAEARAEIEKSARACLYYVDEAPRMLADEVIGSEAHRSLVAYQPLGLV
ncbi:MAG TPA: aldehyde dehydrogenase family protein, partial [Nitrolancea sp.]|nr:aldehyde dehydrogenase family protein [Nitrolancea sp.]